MAVSTAPLYILLNAGSGHKDCETTRATIAAILAEAGRAHEIELVHPKELAARARATVQRARRDGAVVVAAGGDGTLNAVAQAAHAAGCPFGVLPQGTFNYFGRAHGISQDTAEAVHALLGATVQPVQVGMVNDKLFLVNASVGLYPQLLEDRETYKQQFGRSRFVALLAGIVTIVRHQRQLRMTLESGGQSRQIRTPTLFVGNNALQMRQIGVPLADALDKGCLAGIVLRPIGTLAMLWLMVRGLFGQLGEADNVDSFPLRSMIVHPSRLRARRRYKVATDGEINWLRAPLHFRVAETPLLLLKPEHPLAPE